ncbi:MAG: tetratricopeptide repeat protein [Proteobacteria bacterium]|nr:tetratricopeptide repeat protein [Pseudomonadota bacterium]
MHRNIITILGIWFGVFCMVFGFSAAVYAQSAQEYFEQGKAFYNKKKFDDSVAAFKRAIQLQPESIPMAYLNCARAYNMKKDFTASDQYYSFYEEIDQDALKDKKVKAEHDAVSKKARYAYERDASQTTVLEQVNSVLRANGPYYTRQNSGALAYYDVLIRTGFAEPELVTIQQKIVKGIAQEIEVEIQPPAGQPLPNLDRTGWAYIRQKLSKGRQFPDFPVDEKRFADIEALATGWEAFYRSDYDTAARAFDTACQAKQPMPAAYWGRLMLYFQLEKNDSLLSMIDEAEKVYESQGVANTKMYFMLLRAQAWRNLGDIQKSMSYLDEMHRDL